MCGITGFFGKGDRADIEKMTAALLARGPDGEGFYENGDLFLGHRRLSIVDLKHGGQPMTDPESGLVIVYNGEIYNHPQLRRELEKEGCQFQTSHSDTETLLKAFARWGVDCLVRLNGMFAFAIYDKASRKIWLARDRFGEKPLVYCKVGHNFAFASEMTALRLWPGFPGEWNEADIQRFFAWNYLPGQRTVFKNCASVAPGGWLCYELATGEILTGSYWKFELKPDHALKDVHLPELAEELRRLLVQAVSRRLMADTPIGFFLSGGIDSSAILAAATRCREASSLNAYVIGFQEKSFDESAKAQKVASFLGVPLEIEWLTEAVMTDSIDAIFSSMGEPFGDASLIPTCHLAAFARRHVKVALSGDGGDELFGGYDPLAALVPAAFGEFLLPGPLPAIFRKALDLLPASDRNMSFEFRLKRFLRGLSWPGGMRIPVWMSGLDPAEIQRFFANPLSARELFADALKLADDAGQLSTLDKALLFFTCIYLPDDILVKSDRACMMSSLESRAVFLDNDLVDFCAHLPARFKYRHGQRKYILKKALEGWLPGEIINQPKKGFGIPLNIWLRHLPLPVKTAPGLKPGIIEECQSLHNRRLGDFRYFLWDLQAFSRMAA